MEVVDEVETEGGTLTGSEEDMIWVQRKNLEDKE